jgi:hypothetical protein
VAVLEVLVTLTLVHWLKLPPPPPVFVALRVVVLVGFKPGTTNPTVSVGFVTGRELGGLAEIDATTDPGVGPPAVIPLAFVRTFVMRSTRERPADAGARIGIPKNVSEFPFTTPWKMLAPTIEHAVVALAQLVLTGTPAVGGVAPTVEVPTI